MGDSQGSQIVHTGAGVGEVQLLQRLLTERFEKQTLGEMVNNVATPDVPELLCLYKSVPGQLDSHPSPAAASLVLANT